MSYKINPTTGKLDYYESAGAVPPPANGSVTYSDGKIIEIVNGSKTYNITYDSDYIKTITDGTTTWTFIYSNGVITGWTV